MVTAKGACSKAGASTDRGKSRWTSLRQIHYFCDQTLLTMILTSRECYPKRTKPKQEKETLPVGTRQLFTDAYMCALHL
jgi:hypothetical protein